MNLKIIAGLFLLFFLVSMTAAESLIEIPGAVYEVRGAGMAMTNFDKNPRPDMVLMIYDTSQQPNRFRYKIGWNLDANGISKNWSDDKIIPGIGWLTHGSGVAIAQLDNDPRPEMILMIYYYYEENPFRYKIGWNLDTQGVTTHWDKDYTEIKGVGWYAGGADVLVAQLDNNPRPEMIFLAYDSVHDQMNFFRYRVGWNLDKKGKAASWSNYIEGLGVGYAGNGAGIAIARMDDNPRPEFILAAYDYFPNQPSYFRYRVAWNLNLKGVPARWDSINELPGVETVVKGVGISVCNLDADERPELIIMGYYNLFNPKNNVFGYRVLKNKTAAKQIVLEMDKLNNAKWLPKKVTRGETDHNLQSIYKTAGIDLNMVQGKGNIKDLKKGKPYTDAEIHCFLTAHMNKKVPKNKKNAWPMYGAVLSSHVDDIPALTFIHNQQRGFVIFSNECKDEVQYLRTAAHQIGHALNLQHSDGDAWEMPYSTALKGYSLMNPPWKLAEDWNFTWSAASFFHFYQHLSNRWQPHGESALTNCHWK